MAAGCLDATSADRRGELSVRPLQAADREPYLRAFHALSPESRYLRFAAAKPALSSAELRYLLEVDHHDHEALVVYDEAGAVVAVGRYVALADRPGSAEVAVTIADAWQGRGVGPRLLALLACRAREEGIGRFVATVLPENRRALRALARAGFDPGRHDDGLIRLEAELPLPLEERSCR